MKKTSLVSTIVIGIIGIVAGIVLALLANEALALICIICGVFTLLSGIPQLISAINGLVKKQTIAIFDLIMAVITVVVGLMLIFSRNENQSAVANATMAADPVFGNWGQKLLSLSLNME